MKTLNLITSAIALILSIIALCTSLKAFAMDDMAYVGWIIAILSTLVLILMGWNIYSVIDIKNAKKEIMHEVKTELKNHKQETNKVFCTFYDMMMSSQFVTALNANNVLSAATYWAQFVLNPYRENFNDVIHPIILNLHALFSYPDIVMQLKSDEYNILENVIRALESLEPHSPDVKKYLVLLKPPNN
jgi:hypothetical protein